MQISTPPPKKGPTKNGLSFVWKHLLVFLKISLFIVQFSKRYLKTSSWTFFMKSCKRIHLRLLWNLFQSFYQLARWEPRTDIGHCRSHQRTFAELYFCALEDLGTQISNDFLLYRIVIPKALWIWLNAHFFKNKPFRTFRKVIFRNN